MTSNKDGLSKVLLLIVSLVSDDRDKIEQPPPKSEVKQRPAGASSILHCRSLTQQLQPPAPTRRSHASPARNASAARPSSSEPSANATRTSSKPSPTPPQELQKGFRDSQFQSRIKQIAFLQIVMGKRRKAQNPRNEKSSRRLRDEDMNLEDMDDEIDAFHKQWDVIPLDVNGDAGDSDDDNEHPVFDFEDDEDDDVNDAQDTGFAAKIKRQQKFFRAKFGGIEDETHDDEEEDEEEKKDLWVGIKNPYYYGDNGDFELQSSDDDSPTLEEQLVVKVLEKRANSLEMEDFGLQDDGDSEDNEDDSDKGLTLEEISIKGKSTTNPQACKEAVDDTVTSYKEVKKDLNALSKEEPMDVLYSSAPELVGLLSELNDALEQLEIKVNPLFTKVKEQEIMLEGGMHYLEVKQLLLLAYCQAITFYLLLKSEGEPVRDHPVIAHLVEIKGLLDKIKQLNENLPSELDEIFKNDHSAETVGKSVRENAKMASDSVTDNHHNSSSVSADTDHGAAILQALDVNELKMEDILRVHDDKGRKHKHQNDQVGVQSMEMLKVRAALEEKLKQKGVFRSIAPMPGKGKKCLKPLNGQLETFDDFDDDATGVERGSLGMSNWHVSSFRSSKISQLVPAQPSKPKVVSGDDDLPKGDDIGERRRKHELRVLAGAGIKSESDAWDELVTFETDRDDNMEAGDDGEAMESEDEFYEQVKCYQAEKLAAKSEIYTWVPAIPSLPETVDGKRHITYQMEKNRGLTCARKKLTKNPRKKYRSKHEKAVVCRKGQVRDIRKPTGPYGGEGTGINLGISRSTRFKN